MLSYPLVKFEIQKYYQNHAKRSSKNEPKFNGVYSRDNLSVKIKDGAYIINLDESSDIGTHWVALYVINNDVIHFNKEIKTFTSNKNIRTNIFRIEAYDSIMCGYFWIRFINFMLAGKTLTDFTNLFSQNNFKRNHDITLNYFMINV